MFSPSIQRNSKILNSMIRLTKISSVHSRYFISDHDIHLHVQIPNRQYKINYANNLNNDFSDKLSRTIICCKYLRLIKNSIRGKFIIYFFYKLYYYASAK